jgi:hypothetical protein
LPGTGTKRKKPGRFIYDHLPKELERLFMVFGTGTKINDK